MSSTPISNRQTKRDRALGFGLSACLHLAALLLLSLISLNVGSSLGSKLTFTQTLDSQASLDQMPAFELESPVAELLESPSRPGLSMDLQLAAAQPQAHSSTLATQIALAAAIAEQPESPAAAAQASSSTIPQAGAAIQARVGKAGGKTGEVQFALAWANINDVDLHVIAPSGERISHLHRRSQCKGMLDVDMNVDGESNEPVENIRWISGAPWGRYTVLVNMFQVHRGAPSARSEFELLAELGASSKVIEQSVSLTDQVAVFRFFYVADNQPTAQREALLRELQALQQREELRAQPLLANAEREDNPQARDRQLNALIAQYPHTDAAIAAMRLLGGSITKR